MRKLLGLLGLFSVVYTIDYDGEVRTRIAWRWKNRYKAAKIRHKLLMNPDGSFMSTHSYMTAWKPAYVSKRFRRWMDTSV